MFIGYKDCQDTPHVTPHVYNGRNQTFFIMAAWSGKVKYFKFVEPILLNLYF